MKLSPGLYFINLIFTINSSIKLDRFPKLNILLTSAKKIWTNFVRGDKLGLKMRVKFGWGTNFSCILVIGGLTSSGPIGMGLSNLT